MLSPALLRTLLFLLPTPALLAATLFVDDTRGNDANNGTEDQPLATLARAVARAVPGDEIRVVPGDQPIHQHLGIANRSGEPGKPIIFDGGGRTLLGTRPLNPADWEEVRPGLFRSTIYMAPQIQRANSARSFIARCFMVFDDKVQNMGLRDKLSRPPLPPPDALKPGEWTYHDEDRAFYLAIPPGQTLAEARIALPYLQNGVYTRGDVRHWIIRNVTVRRFMNDGFNFHGQSDDLILEDIAAYECSDDGMSAHGDCRITVRRFIAEGNATGICHIDNSSSVNEELTLRNNFGPNLYLLGSGTHEVTNSRISALGNGLRIGNNKQSPVVTLKLRDSVIEDRDAEGARYDIGTSGVVEIIP